MVYKLYYISKNNQVLKKYVLSIEEYTIMNDITYEKYREMIKKINPTEDCPVRNLMDKLSRKWNLRVIFELTKNDSIRFGELKRQIGKITNASLSSTLKELEEYGFLERKQFNEIPPHVEYSLTDKGKSLYPIFVVMEEWVQAYGE